MCIPSHILLTLLPNLNIQQHKRMHPPLPILLHPIIETIRLPSVGEEDKGDGLAEVIELETAGAHGVHDGGVVDDC